MKWTMNITKITRSYKDKKVATTMGRSNINCFRISPHNNWFTIIQDSGFFPRSHTDYYIFNLGRTKVLVEGWYGTQLGWIGVLDGKILEPGHETKIIVSDKPYFMTGLKISNSSNIGALVHCSKVSGYKLWVEGNATIRPDINTIAEHLVPFGVGKISKVQVNLESIINFFWPSGSETTWDKISKQVIPLLDGKTQRHIQTLLMEDMLHVKEHINIIQSQIKTHQPSTVKADYYMRVVEQLILLEKKFSEYRSTHSEYVNVNFYLLPLYTATVNFKIMFYQFGINNPRLVGLNDEQLSNLLHFSQKLIEDPNLGAVAHVTKTFEDKFHHEYQYCNAELIYNTLVTVRTWCGVTGAEFVCFWRALLDNASGTHYNDVITYSTYFGRPSPYLSHQLVVDEVAPPLVPRLINGRRNRITGIDVYIWRGNSFQGPAKIGGLKIHYINGDYVETGKSTRESNYVDFKNDRLHKLTAWGGDAIDCLEFCFSNGRVETCGTKEPTQGTRNFQLTDHHIVGFYMSNDVPGLGGQAANVSVSFQAVLD